MALRRRDTGSGVVLDLNTDGVPPAAELMALFPKAMAGHVEDDEQARFAVLWQGRVAQMLIEHADDPALISAYPWKLPSFQSSRSVELLAGRGRAAAFAGSKGAQSLLRADEPLRKPLKWLIIAVAASMAASPGCRPGDHEAGSQGYFARIPASQESKSGLTSGRSRSRRTVISFCRAKRSSCSNSSSVNCSGVRSRSSNV
jgi:hypothetical protein